MTLVADRDLAVEAHAAEEKGDLFENGLRSRARLRLPPETRRRPRRETHDGADEPPPCAAGRGRPDGPPPARVSSNGPEATESSSSVT